LSTVAAALAHACEPSDASLVALLWSIKQSQSRAAEVNVLPGQFPVSVPSGSCLKDEDEKGVMDRVVF